jgi:putative transposase
MPHFLTLTLVEWVDLFTREKYKQIIIESLKFSIDKKGLALHAFVIMSNHVHLIASVKDETLNLSSIIRDIKRFTANEIYKVLKKDIKESRRNWLLWIFESQGERSSSNENVKIWQHGNHPVILDRNEIIDERLNYIHENPVKAGICFQSWDYVYSSASQYAGKEGFLDIKFLD